VRTLLFGHSLEVSFDSLDSKRLLSDCLVPVNAVDISSVFLSFAESLDLCSTGLVVVSSIERRMIVLVGSYENGLGDRPALSQRMVSLVSQESSDIMQGGEKLAILAVSHPVSQ